MGTKSKGIIGNRSDRIWNSNTGNSGVIIESSMVNHRDGFAFVAAGDGDIRSSALVTDYDDGSVVMTAVLLSINSKSKSCSLAASLAASSTAGLPL